jgi:hypothetical protein
VARLVPLAPARSAAAILLALSASLAIASCGGDSARAKGPPGSASNPLVAVPNPSPTRTPPVERPGGEAPRAAAPRTSRRSTRTQSGTPSKTSGRIDGPHRRHRQELLGPSAKRPCSLVSKAQARTIIGAPIAEPLQAPLGPTCVYQATSGKPYITLAVQSLDFAALRRQLRNTRRVSAGRRTAYCATYGRPMLYLPLTGHRVLSVSGPCTIAMRFAATSASRLTTRVPA